MGNQEIKKKVEDIYTRLDANDMENEASQEIDNVLELVQTDTEDKKDTLLNTLNNHNIKSKEETNSFLSDQMGDSVSIQKAYAMINQVKEVGSKITFFKVDEEDNIRNVYNSDLKEVLEKFIQESEEN